MNNDILEALEAATKVVTELSAAMKQRGRYDLCVPLLSAEIGLLKASIIETEKYFSELDKA